MPKRKPKSPIEGRWSIVSMSQWDMESDDEDLEPFIEFGPSDSGVFQFGYVYGEMDCQTTERDAKPAVEFSWDGNDESEHAFGRGWTVLEGDDLEGMIFFHLGEASEFSARRPKRGKKGNKR
jgi:hypothetical protein